MTALLTPYRWLLLMAAVQWAAVGVVLGRSAALAGWARVAARFEDRAQVFDETEGLRLVEARHVRAGGDGVDAVAVGAVCGGPDRSGGVGDGARLGRTRP